MKGRWKIPVTTALALALMLWFWPEPEEGPVHRRPDPAGRPNIVLVLADDIGLRIGAYGDPLANTPNIDRLAREGVRFDRMYATAPVCAPSRSALITGLHQQTLGTMHMRTTPEEKGRILGGASSFRYQAVPPDGVKAFPERLRAAGYFASNNAKTDYQFGEPFTIWDESGDKASWRHRPDGVPFFHMRTIMVTHESYGVTWWHWPRSLADLAAQIRNAATLGRYPRLTDPDHVTVPPWLVDAPDTRRQLAQMYDAAHAADIELGRTLDQLRADGVLDNSIIIFTSDNGEGVPRGKRSLTETGLRLPFIVRFPDGRMAGTVRDDLASFVDFAPTFLAMAGAPRPDGLQGRDLFADPAPDYVFAAADRFEEVTTRSKSVRDGRYTYIRNCRTDLPLLYPHKARDMLPAMWDLKAARTAGTLTAVQARYFQPVLAEELYDRQTDPDELTNLAGDPAQRDILSRLRQALDDFNARVGDLSAVPEAEMVARMWPGGSQPETPVPTARIADGHLLLADALPAASIGWRLPTDPAGHWRLYTQPIPLDEIKAGLSARAVRYGYAASDRLEWKAHD